MPLPGLPQPKGGHPKMGQKLLKRQLQKVARERPHLLPKACVKAFEDAAGETQVEHAAVHQGEVSKYRLEIDPSDRHRALALIRDTVDGKPEQSQDLEGVPAGNVFIINAAKGIDIAFPTEIERQLAFEIEQGQSDPVDLDDPEPASNGDLEDDGDDYES